MGPPFPDEALSVQLPWSAAWRLWHRPLQQRANREHSEVRRGAREAVPDQVGKDEEVNCGVLEATLGCLFVFWVLSPWLEG